MYKLLILFSALLYSPIAAIADCYHGNGGNGCMQLAGQFDMQVGPSLMDLMDQRAVQQQQMILRQQQIQMQQQQIQMQQQQMDVQQQEVRSRKLGVLRNSLLSLSESERERAIKEIDSLSESQRGKLLEHLATVSEDERIKGFKFMANISSQQREELIIKFLTH
ncbi:hypothetical protein [Sulfuricella sp.]|uniref:hypothetical protein n=1 Tax=Sulfuricella sp. TaxID=2099377 RepID=UPI002BAA1B70|nr:hypothetical protein [Sulfuricella sp.]HUX64305.1 hypothetical protein [Sulfuricella sp.]